MGKIVISTNSSLDGVIEDPDGREGSPAGGWFNRSGGEDLKAWAALLFEEARRAEALLLGRRTDEWFAPLWLPRSTEFSDLLNGMPKYVVSSTVTDAAWSNATVLAGDVVDEVATLRQKVAGEVLLYASYRLGQTLLEHDLIDEVRLVVFPVVAGGGRHLFGATGAAKDLRLTQARTVGENLALLTYELR